MSEIARVSIEKGKKARKNKGMIERYILILNNILLSFVVILT